MPNIILANRGQTPININTSFEDGEWWVRGNADGYIPQSHPLWKSGRYKSFNDAAFSSLKNYPKSTIGCVYVIQNPAWPDWVKVGKAVDAQDRLNSYQTSDPFRSYILHHHIEVSNRHKVELQVHQELEVASALRKNEWFKITAYNAAIILNNTKE